MHSFLCFALTFRVHFAWPLVRCSSTLFVYRFAVRCVLTLFVLSMVLWLSQDPGRFIAFGRVFSGTIKRGQEVSILGVGGGGFGRKKVQGILMMMGSKPEALGECPAGNVCGVMGIDRYLTKSGTLSDSAQCFPFKTMRFSVSPVVKVAVQAVDSRNLAKLIEGLRRLTKYDGIVQTEHNKQGQIVVAGAGELHLETWSVSMNPHSLSFSLCGRGRHVAECTVSENEQIMYFLSDSVCSDFVTLHHGTLSCSLSLSLSLPLCR